METMTTNAARVYVGTYGKYASGSIAGAWLGLEDYADRDAFIAACLKLHKDEADPELMFQDFEGFPRAYYSESSIDADLWDWLDLNEYERDMLATYQDAVDAKGDIDDAREAFHGIHDSAADFAAEWFEKTGQLNQVSDWLRGHIDWEGVARDMGFDGWVFHRAGGGVYVFLPC